jgi:hypothetical protein
MKIIIGIHGSHAHSDRMEAQRDTWLRDLQGEDYKFFVGDPAVEAEDIVHVPYADGPVWEGHRRTLVLNRKAEALIRHAIENDCDYVFKCDDDTYIRVPELLASGFEQYDYSGFTEPHWTVRTGQYRWAQGGAGYWLSRKAMEIVAANGLHLARAEDFAVGELLAQHGITPHHDQRYNAASKPKSEDWITLHRVTPAAMRTLHA